MLLYSNGNDNDYVSVDPKLGFQLILRGTHSGLIQYLLANDFMLYWAVEWASREKSMGRLLKADEAALLECAATLCERSRVSTLRTALSQYVADVIGERIPTCKPFSSRLRRKVEKIILDSACGAAIPQLIYATEAMKTRWPEAEPILAGRRGATALVYAEFMGHRWTGPHASLAWKTIREAGLQYQYDNLRSPIR